MLDQPKPKFGEPCNGCGYCCTVEPCKLANEYLHCVTGPCVALEVRDGRSSCGLVRNPLGYLFKAANPNADVPVLASAPTVEVGNQLSSQLAAALGIGKGCDADDSDKSREWPFKYPT